MRLEDAEMEDAEMWDAEMEDGHFGSWEALGGWCAWCAYVVLGLHAACLSLASKPGLLKAVNYLLLVLSSTRG